MKFKTDSEYYDFLDAFRRNIDSAIHINAPGPNGEFAVSPNRTVEYAEQVTLKYLERLKVTSDDNSHLFGGNRIKEDDPT